MVSVKLAKLSLKLSGPTSILNFFSVKMDTRDLEVFDDTLRKLQFELSSDKTTIRNKAFASLQDYLDRRSDDIDRLMTSQTYTSETTWQTLFHSTLEGLKQHVEKLRSTALTAALENKCGLYAQVLTRLVAVANGNTDQISKKVLLEEFLSLLKNNQDMDKHFGMSLFLIVDQYLVLSKKMWVGVKCDLYNQYLTLLFHIVENSIANDFYVNCLSNAIQHGLQHLNISSTLEEHLVPMLRKIEAETTESGKMNLFKIAYLIAFETIVNKRVVICQSLFSLAKGILTNYNPTRIRDEPRSHIIKILDLIIVAETVTDDPKALNQQNWNFLLQSCTQLIEKEIERADGSNMAYSGNFTPDPIFIDFAAKVWALTFWDDKVWVNSTGSEQPHKRMRYVEKYQALINRTVSTSSNSGFNRKYSWRWLLILGKVMEMKSIEGEDYEAILELLSEFQPHISKPEQFPGFYLTCKTLLTQNYTLNLKTNQKKVADYWHKIVETAARSCSSINPISNENMMLIRLILKHNQHKGEIFIESLLDTFFTNSINRSNDAIQTLITIMLTFNINFLSDPADKVEKILSYLFMKQKVTAKLVPTRLQTEEKPKAELVARLIVLCNMYKSTVDEKVKEKWLEEAITYGQDSWVNEEYKR